MTILLSIDPGKDTGWARFEDKALVACGLASADAPPDVFGDELVVEVPQVYRGRKTRGNPNDLVTLALDVGQFVRMARDSLMQYRLVRPHAWKGSTPKHIHHPRVLAALTDAEREVVAASVKGIAAGKRHNVIDSVGLGLWALGRLAR